MFRRIFYILIFSFLFLGCWSNPIKELKKGKVMYFGSYIPIKQIEDGLAGAIGDVKWRSFKIDDIKNPDVTIVELSVKKDGKETALVQFYYNEKRDIHEISYIELDGKASSVALLFVAMMF